jgi:hypothetical protein
MTSGGSEAHPQRQFLRQAALSSGCGRADAGAAQPHGGKAFAQHQGSNPAQQDDVKQRNDEIDLTDRQQGDEQLHAQRGSGQTACGQHQRHGHINGATP